MYNGEGKFGTQGDNFALILVVATPLYKNISNQAHSVSIEKLDEPHASRKIYMSANYLIDYFLSLTLAHINLILNFNS